MCACAARLSRKDRFETRTPDKNNPSAPGFRTFYNVGLADARKNSDLDFMYNTFKKYNLKDTTPQVQNMFNITTMVIMQNVQLCVGGVDENSLQLPPQ